MYNRAVIILYSNNPRMLLKINFTQNFDPQTLLKTSNPQTLLKISDLQMLLKIT